jgi:prevent-host-death family protein
MKRTASVVELKAKLSEHLRQVKSGHELIVTERGIPVARMLPLDDGERRSTRRVRLTRSGALKPGRGKLPAALKQPPSGRDDGSAVVAALIAERRDGASDR